MCVPLSVLRGQRSPVQKWTSSDYRLMVALEEYERMLCDGCGQPMHESMDMDSDGEWSAPEPMRCHACTAISDRGKAYKDANAPQALKFSAERRRPSPEA